MREKIFTTSMLAIMLFTVIYGVLVIILGITPLPIIIIGVVLGVIALGILIKETIDVWRK